MSLTLQAFDKEETGLFEIPLPVSDGEVTVGRASSNDYRIPHESVSGSHAKLVRGPEDTVEVVDCGSSNGTFVNGIRIDRMPIAAGDVVKFAFLNYRVVDQEPSLEATGGNGESTPDGLDATRTQQIQLPAATNGSPQDRIAEQVASAKEERDRAEQERIQAEGERDRALEERDRESARADALEKVGEEVEALRRQQEAWEAENTRLHAEVSRIEQEKAAFEEQLAHEQNRAAGLDHALAESNAALHQTGANLEAAAQAKSEIDSRLESLQNEITSERAAAQEKREELEAAIAAVEAALASTRAERDGLASDLGERTHEAAQANERLGVAREELDALEKELGAVREERAALDGDLQESRRLTKEQGDSIARLEQAVAALESRSLSLHEQLEEQGGELSESRQSHDSTRHELESTREGLARTESDLASARQRTEEVIGERDTLSGEFETFRREAENTRLALEDSLEQETALRQNRESLLEERTREVAETHAKWERTRDNLKERERIIVERDGEIASLQYELEQRNGRLEAAAEQIASLEANCHQWQAAYEGIKSNFDSTSGDLGETQRQLFDRIEELQRFRSGFRAFLEKVREDWGFWMVDLNLPERGDAPTVEECLEDAEAVRAMVRSELDQIEPVWQEFGNRVQVELEEKCAALRETVKELKEDVEARSAQVESLSEDVRGLRNEVDAEVRRAQGLSRRGMHVEIPERFESMVIANDREQQILLSLVNQLEFLEHLLEGYEGSSKLSEVVHDLTELRRRIINVLEENGVHMFAYEPGTELTPKHRPEVQILSKKAWGTRGHAEQPFRPGKVRKVVRPGYRVGEGEGAVLLRKVEVLIREVER